MTAEDEIRRDGQRGINMMICKRCYADKIEAAGLL